MSSRRRLTLGSGWACLAEADAHPRAEVAALHPGDAGPAARLAAWEESPASRATCGATPARTWVELRVGSHPDRSPIFARFPVTLHRLPPRDAVIKWAYVVRRRVGHRLEWRLQLTLESRVLNRPPVAVGTGVCAVNLGWRRILDDEGQVVGLRAGYVVDPQGYEREIRVPDYVPSHGAVRSYPVLGAVGKCDDLARIRDRALEATQLQLSAWLAERGGVPAQWQARRSRRGGAAPRPMADQLRGYSAWRAALEVAEVRRRLETATRAGGRGGFVVLEAWAKQDRHLETWQASMRDRQIAHRRESWRVVAADLCRRYATILVGEGKLYGDRRMGATDSGGGRPVGRPGAAPDGEGRRAGRVSSGTAEGGVEDGGGGQALRRVARHPDVLVLRLRGDLGRRAVDRPSVLGLWRDLGSGCEPLPQPLGEPGVRERSRAAHGREVARTV